MSEYSIFTSESVSEGHPDKVADQISDAVLDAIIARDPLARVAVETLVKTGMAVVAGEVTTSCYVDLEDIVRDVIIGIGYNSSDVGFDGATCAVLNGIGKQSVDINMGVDRAKPEDWRSRLNVWLCNQGNTQLNACARLLRSPFGRASIGATS